MKIPVDKIRDVIGSGGKVIREIVEKTGAKINIDDDGTIKIASASGKEIEAAKKWIHSIVAEPEVGVIYEGTVVKVADFGAFVNFFGPRTAWFTSRSWRRQARRQGPPTWSRKATRSRSSFWASTSAARFACR
jgi:polyribonucleotide nucleotidyltransferase